MSRKIATSLLLVLALAATAAAQQTVRGQFLLPDGDLPSNPLRFYLTRDDGQVNEYRFSDSNGRFILERLSTLFSYTITVESDGSTYDTTVYSFLPSQQATPRITLRPLTRKIVSTSPTVSVAAGYKPLPKAAELHKAALKEIEKQEFDAAEKHLRQAIGVDPKFFAPFNDLGALLMQQKKYAEAEKVLRQALQADPKSVHGLLNLGITLNHRQQYAEAIPVLREALRLEPGLVAAHLHLGIALVETDEFAEAEQALLRAVKTPGSEQIAGQLYLGKLYARTGDFEKAIAALEAYLQKAPNAANAAEVRALIDRMKRERAARR